MCCSAPFYCFFFLSCENTSYTQRSGWNLYVQFKDQGNTYVTIIQVVKYSRASILAAPPLAVWSVISHLLL